MDYIFAWGNGARVLNTPWWILDVFVGADPSIYPTPLDLKEQT